MRFSASDISVIIPSYNSTKTIRKCLDALLKQSQTPLEIILVDSSDDETPTIISRDYPLVTLVHVDHRIFPGPARNIGARLAKGPILAFLDSDCITRPNWAEQIVLRHNEGYQAVGGSIYVGNPENIYDWAGYLLEFREFLPQGNPRLVKHIPSCNMTYRKDLFLTNEGFPESYYPQEDLIFDYLLIKQGVEILFDPVMEINHFCRDTLKGFLSHQHRIGRVTRCVLQRLNIQGSAFARNKWFAYFISPFLGFVKAFRTISCFLTQFPKIAFRRIGVIPIILWGVIWWSRGFSAGARKGLSGIIGWGDPNEPIFAIINDVKESGKK